MTAPLKGEAWNDSESRQMLEHALSRIVLKGVGSFKFRDSEQNRAFEFCHRSGILHGVLQFLQRDAK
jgi:hypothetical protein